MAKKFQKPKIRPGKVFKARKWAQNFLENIKKAKTCPRRFQKTKIWPEKNQEAQNLP